MTIYDSMMAPFGADDLRPDMTPENVTTTVAGLFAGIALGMRNRGVPAERAAHFLMKLMFCMFAEDVELLEDRVFTRILDRSWARPDRLSSRLRGLFQSMAKGGDFGADSIRYFNGGLFADAEVVDLAPNEIEILMEVNRCDWSSVEPSIFGTLFERILDPSKRGLVGAHYTGKDDMLAVLRPVVLTPLRREWEVVKRECEELRPLIRQEAAEAQGQRRRKESPSRRAFDGKLLEFVRRLANAKVLDPACGSGNFLYAAIHLILELEREVLRYGASNGASILPHVSPAQLAGIEHDPYARHLAQVVVWIGYLQWKFHHGFQPEREPILDAVEGIRQADAILDLSDPANPKEPEWPEAEFIVGNPPFLGGKKLRAELGDEYVDHLFRAWNGRVKAEADLCCYWLEKARAMIKAGWCKRAGLLATQGIRGGANRETLKRINETGGIFFAESDRDWVLDGATVHVSMIGFDDGTETARQLNGKLAAAINNDLTVGVDVTQACRLDATRNISFMGDTKGGKFDIQEAKAAKMLIQPNPNGRPSSDVIVPWINGLDVTRRNRREWIIDYGTNCTEAEAALYEAPFELIRQQVYPERQGNKRDAYRERWWLHVEARSGMRQSLKTLARFIVTTTVSKHRLFVWEVAPTLPDHQLIAFAFADNYHFGLLHSHIHEVWARSHGTQVRERESGFRYTPTSCFETFPLPSPTDGQRQVIDEAAQELDRLRNNWLNPSEWTREEVLEFPGSSDGPWGRYVQAPDLRGIGTVRYPRVVPKDEAHAAKLAARTLTGCPEFLPSL